MKTKKAEKLGEDQYSSESYRERNEEWLWKLRSACWVNALSLLKDSKLLLKNKRYARSFFLSFTSLEELGKYLFVCDYITGIVSKKEFEDSFVDHKLKIAYAYNNAEINKDKNGSFDATLVYDKSKFIDWTKCRNNSLYISIANVKQFTTPESEITEDMARGMYKRTENEIDQIRGCEFISERIGSEAFYK